MIDTRTEVKSGITGLSYKTQAGGGDCQSRNLVYILNFGAECDYQYVGETGMSLRERMNGHRYDLRHDDVNKPVPFHCSQHGHSPDDVKVCIFRRLDETTDTARRRRVELESISQLMTDAPHSINIQHALHRARDGTPRTPNGLMEAD
jgi:hypothetical protein